MSNGSQRVKSIKEKLVRGLKERGCVISETHDNCPILVFSARDNNCDLDSYLLTRGIIAVSSFENLGKNYVRVHVPAKAEDFLERLSDSQDTQEV